MNNIDTIIQDMVNLETEKRKLREAKDQAGKFELDLQFWTFGAVIITLIAIASLFEQVQQYRNEVVNRVYYETK